MAEKESAINSNLRAEEEQKTLAAEARRRAQKAEESPALLKARKKVIEDNIAEAELEEEKNPYKIANLKLKLEETLEDLKQPSLQDVKGKKEISEAISFSQLYEILREKGGVVYSGGEANPAEVIIEGIEKLKNDLAEAALSEEKLKDFLGSDNFKKFLKHFTSRENLRNTVRKLFSDYANLVFPENK